MILSSRVAIEIVGFPKKSYLMSLALLTFKLVPKEWYKFNQ